VIQPEPIGFLNTGLPVVVLAGLAVVLPHLLVSADTRSHLVVAAGMAATAIALLSIGAAIFALAYGLRGGNPGEAFAAEPSATLGYFLGLSAKASLIWLPVLGLVWFAKAQAVEKRRGEDVARTGSR